MIDHQFITLATVDIVKEVGKFINNELGSVSASQIEVKERNSLVSYVDKEAEKSLVAELKKLIPAAGFITEEDTVKNDHNAAYTWIIDPLDGTSNFLHNIPHFAISVGLKEGSTLVSGVVMSVVSGEIFWASKGGGAYMNHKPIYTSNTAVIENALIATGFPYKVKDVAPLIRTLGYFMRHARGLRRMGAAALDLAFLAAGRFDCYYETTLNAWDVAAGALILEEAGGIISDFDGGENYLFGGSLIATNGHIHDEILRIVKANFY